MKLEYNAPVILTFTLIATTVMIIDTVFSGFTGSLFAFRGTFDFGAPLDYFRLFSYTAGHANWPHLLGNFSIILLIGPILERADAPFQHPGFLSGSQLLCRSLLSLCSSLLNYRHRSLCCCFYCSLRILNFK